MDISKHYRADCFSLESPWSTPTSTSLPASSKDSSRLLWGRPRVLPGNVGHRPHCWAAGNSSLGDWQNGDEMKENDQEVCCWVRAGMAEARGAGGGRKHRDFCLGEKVMRGMCLDLCFKKIPLAPGLWRKHFRGWWGAWGGDEGCQGRSMETNGDAIWSQGKRTVAWLLALALTLALCHRHVHAYACAPSRALPPEFSPLCHIARPTQDPFTWSPPLTSPSHQHSCFGDLGHYPWLLLCLHLWSFSISTCSLTSTINFWRRGLWLVHRFWPSQAPASFQAGRVPGFLGDVVGRWVSVLERL